MNLERKGAWSAPSHRAPERSKKKLNAAILGEDAQKAAVDLDRLIDAMKDNPEMSTQYKLTHAKREFLVSDALAGHMSKSDLVRNLEDMQVQITGVPVSRPEKSKRTPKHSYDPNAPVTAEEVARVKAEGHAAAKSLKARLERVKEKGPYEPWVGYSGGATERETDKLFHPARAQEIGPERHERIVRENAARHASPDDAVETPTDAEPEAYAMNADTAHEPLEEMDFQPADIKPMSEVITPELMQESERLAELGTPEAEARRLAERKALDAPYEEPAPPPEADPRVHRLHGAQIKDFFTKGSAFVLALLATWGLYEHAQRTPQEKPPISTPKPADQDNRQLKTLELVRKAVAQPNVASPEMKQAPSRIIPTINFVRAVKSNVGTDEARRILIEAMKGVPLSPGAKTALNGMTGPMLVAGPLLETVVEGRPRPKGIVSGALTHTSIKAKTIDWRRYFGDVGVRDALVRRIEIAIAKRKMTRREGDAVIETIRVLYERSRATS